MLVDFSYLLILLSVYSFVYLVSERASASVRNWKALEHLRLI